MKTCPYCGSILQDDAVICTVCVKVVQTRTHYSPAEPDELPLVDHIEPPRQQGFFSAHLDQIKASLLLLIFIMGVILTNLEFSRLQQQHVNRNEWSASLGFSRVSIDRFSHSDQVIVKGRVTNLTDRNLKDVVVRASVLNAVSQQIGEVVYSLEPDILLPGTSAEFSITIFCDADLVRQVKVEIHDAEVQREILRKILLS